MKSIALVCLALVGLAAAAPTPPEPHREVLHTLIMRGELLVENTLRVLHSHKEKGNEHLLQALEHQIVMVEAFVKELKALHGNPLQNIGLHHLHTIEESLLHLENRISEELAAVEDTNDHHDPDNKVTLEELEKRAKKLIDTAEKALSDHEGGKHGEREKAAVRDEIEVVQSLLEKTRGEHGEKLQESLKSLERHERTLHQLIERLDTHGHDF